MILMTPELSGEVSTLRNHLLHVIRPEKSRRRLETVLPGQFFFSVSFSHTAPGGGNGSDRNYLVS